MFPKIQSYFLTLFSRWQHCSAFMSCAQNVLGILQKVLIFCSVCLRIESFVCVSKNLKIKIYRTTTLPVVLYGCETWSLTLREERRLRVFENKVLRRIFGPRKDEVTRDWRRLHNEEINFFCTPHPISCG